MWVFCSKERKLREVVHLANIQALGGPHHAADPLAHRDTTNHFKWKGILTTTTTRSRRLKFQETGCSSLEKLPKLAKIYCIIIKWFDQWELFRKLGGPVWKQLPMLAKIQCANTLPLRMTGKVEQNDYVAKDSNLHFFIRF